MVYADRYSGWTKVALMHQDAKASLICNILCRFFVNYGIPEEIACDGGPPIRTWGISQQVSSVYYPQSNGGAEAAVRHMKQILTTSFRFTRYR